jgi:hypothetical protein
MGDFADDVLDQSLEEWLLDIDDPEWREREDGYPLTDIPLKRKRK